MENQNQQQQGIVENPTAPEPTVKKVEKGDMTKAPPWCNFMRGHVYAVNGWWYRCVGYTPQFEVVLKVVGPTSDTKKKFRARGIPLQKIAP